MFTIFVCQSYLDKTVKIQLFFFKKKHISFYSSGFSFSFLVDRLKK